MHYSFLYISATLHSRWRKTATSLIDKWGHNIIFHKTGWHCPLQFAWWSLVEGNSQLGSAHCLCSLTMSHLTKTVNFAYRIVSGFEYFYLSNNIFHCYRQFYVLKIGMSLRTEVKSNLTCDLSLDNYKFFLTTFSLTTRLPSQFRILKETNSRQSHHSSSCPKAMQTMGWQIAVEAPSQAWYKSVAALHYCCQKNFPSNTQHSTAPAPLWSPQVSAASLKNWCWVNAHYKAQVLQRCCVPHCHNENPAPSICQLYLAHSAFSLTLGKLKGFKKHLRRTCSHIFR